MQDIRLLVNSFYSAAREDDLLKDIFNEQIQDKWPQHLEKMYRFWQTVLLDSHTYTGTPFPPHAYMPIGHIHFDRWKILFVKTIDALFVGERAEHAKWQGTRMADIFLNKINYLQNQNM